MIAILYIGFYAFIAMLLSIYAIKKRVFKKVTKNDVSTIMILLIGSILATILISYGLSKFGIIDLEQYKQSVDIRTKEIPIWASMIVTSIFIPIIEELIFRFYGFQFTMSVFSKKIPEKDREIGTIIGISILFGLAHDSLLQKIYAIICGLILGTLYCYEIRFNDNKARFIRNKNLVRPILFHILFNSIGCVSFYIQMH